MWNRLSVLGLTFILLGGIACEKTPVDQMADLIEQMLDVQVEAMDLFFDVVEDNYDICNKAVRVTKQVLQEQRSLMRDLHDQLLAIKKTARAGDYQKALERTRSEMTTIFEGLYKMQEEKYHLMEAFQGHCPNHVGTVAKNFGLYLGLFDAFVGSDY